MMEHKKQNLNLSNFSNKNKGLTAEQAKEKLRAEGFNNLPSSSLVLQVVILMRLLGL